MAPLFFGLNYFGNDMFAPFTQNNSDHNQKIRNKYIEWINQKY